MRVSFLNHTGVYASPPQIIEWAVSRFKLKHLNLKYLKWLDARYFQLAFLISLLLFGALARDFSLTAWQVLFALASAVGTQALWQFALKLPNRHNLQGYLSALVTTCGISILVRSDVSWVHPLLACLAISSKFTFRFGSKESRGHILNPANLAAFCAMMLMPHAWLSPGQWGQETLAAMWMIALGATVTGQVKRWDVSLTFLAAWLGLLAARLLWLGYAPSLAVDMWLHQALNGATLLFAFFMISDPMTTPQHAGARISYAVCVAITAFAWQYGLFKPQGLIVALFIWSFTVPLWNWMFQKKRFIWNGEAK
ncbi:MAG: RnfABCDGE type electron transport complex subunit D [Betaproteobacteria bacterium]